MRLVCVAFALFIAACHGHDHGSYDTFQACYVEHTVDEALPVQEAIVVCCLDHPIMGESPACGATAADCVAYLGTNLTGVDAAEVSAACDEYELQKGQ